MEVPEASGGLGSSLEPGAFQELDVPWKATHPTPLQHLYKHVNQGHPQLLDMCLTESIISQDSPRKSLKIWPREVWLWQKQHEASTLWQSAARWPIELHRRPLVLTASWEWLDRKSLIHLFASSEFLKGAQCPAVGIVSVLSLRFSEYQLASSPQLDAAFQGRAIHQRHTQLRNLLSDFLDPNLKQKLTSAFMGTICYSTDSVRL